MCLSDKEPKRDRLHPLSIVMMGDSNTEGYGLEPGEAYPELIESWFKGQAAVYNCGVSGSCVIQKKLLNQWIGMPYVFEDAYQRALKLKAEIYIVNLGTNDATDGEEEGFIDPYGNLIAHKALFSENYQGIIDGIFTANPEALVFLCIPIPIRKSIWRKHKQEYLEILAEDIRRISRHFNLICIDLMAEFMQLEDMDSLYLPDGLHLNAAGAERVAKVVWTELMAAIAKLGR